MVGATPNGERQISIMTLAVYRKITCRVFLVLLVVGWLLLIARWQLVVNTVPSKYSLRHLLLLEVEFQLGRRSQGRVAPGIWVGVFAAARVLVGRYGWPE
jgi:hypothetical protein